MTYTYLELLDKLKKEQEIDLLERLEINSEDLVDRFEDKILERIDEIEEEAEEEEDITATYYGIER